MLIWSFINALLEGLIKVRLAKSSRQEQDTTASLWGHVILCM